MTPLWPWLVLAGLGAFHGLNPAMGWLFAVALGLYRQSRRVVLLSLVPIALGHALAIAVVVYLVVGLGQAVDAHVLRILTGCLLIGVIVGALVDRHHTPAWLRVGLVMGVLGGYTTFSTFAQETLGLLDARDFAVAVAYAGGSVALGVTAAWIGTHVGHTL